MPTAADAPCSGPCSGPCPGPCPGLGYAAGRGPRWARVSLVGALGLGLALLLGADAVDARPGGGQSFSGGGGGGGGGGGEGIGVLIELLLWLCIRHPGVGIPLTLVVIAFFVVKSWSGTSLRSWSTTTAAPSGPVRARPMVVARARLDQLRQVDPQFSVVLFEDFVYFLYAALQRARGVGFESLAPYIVPDLAQSLRDQTLADVRGIVIGAVRIVGFSGVQSPTIVVELEFEANAVEVLRSGQERRFYVVDRLRLERSPQARSRPPARARTLDCPNCGAPLEAVRGTHCTYCRQDVGYGRFDWNVTAWQNLSKAPRGPLLTGNVDEVGTDLPTIVDPGAMPRFGLLRQRDPGLTWDALAARLAHVWSELQVAWSTRNPARIRPYVTDNLFQSMVYWIDLYLRERCRNLNENGRILRLELSNVLSDASYDAVTVRVFATGLDYTISDDGRVLSGSRTRPRTYSEYWTLIRGVARKGASRGNTSCPNCGAPLSIGMAGNCEYCQVKVTTGDFDWVLSRIEQDEVYAG